MTATEIKESIENEKQKLEKELLEEKAKELGIELSDRIGPTKANITSGL